MKRYFVLGMIGILFVAVMLGGCGGSKTTPGPTSPSVSGDSLIEITHDGNSGLTFGIQTDQVKRYQTFVATNYSNIYGIGIKIRKNSATDKYNNVSVELFDTDTNNQPLNRLAGVNISCATLGIDFTEITVPFSYQGMVAGKTYAVVLSQVGQSAMANAGFEWCTKGQASATLAFGKYNGTSWEDEGGRYGWMKIYTTADSGHKAPLGIYSLQYCDNTLIASLIYGSNPCTFEASVHFPQTVLASYSGGKITKICFLARSVPCKIRVYNNETNGPGTQLFETSVTALAGAASWFEVSLPTPIELSSDSDIWIAYESAVSDTFGRLGAESFASQCPSEYNLYRKDGGAWASTFSTLKLKMIVEVQ